MWKRCTPGVLLWRASWGQRCGDLDSLTTPPWRPLGHPPVRVGAGGHGACFGGFSDVGTQSISTPCTWGGGTIWGRPGEGAIRGPQDPPDALRHLAGDLAPPDINTSEASRTPGITSGTGARRASQAMRRGISTVAVRAGLGSPGLGRASTMSRAPLFFSAALGAGFLLILDEAWLGLRPGARLSLHGGTRLQRISGPSTFAEFSGRGAPSILGASGHFVAALWGRRPGRWTHHSSPTAGSGVLGTGVYYQYSSAAGEPRS